MVPEVLDKETTTEINSPFLSMRMSKKLPISNGKWIPVPVDVDAFYARAVWPKYASKEQQATNSAIGRVYGQYVSGGYTDPDFVGFTQDMWDDAMKKAHLQPLFDSDSGFVGVDLESIYAASKHNLPSPAQMALLYTEEAVQFAESFSQPIQPEAVPGPSITGPLDLMYLADSALPMSLGAHRSVKPKNVGGSVPQPRKPKQLPAPKKQSQKVARVTKGGKQVRVAFVEEEEEAPVALTIEQQIEADLEEEIRELEEKMLAELNAKSEREQEEEDYTYDD
jgi:hypothetical protein